MAVKQDSHPQDHLHANATHNHMAIYLTYHTIDHTYPALEIRNKEILKKIWSGQIK